jgi:hypothetical protein
MPLATLTVVPNALEAEELCGLLRVNGIECTYRRTSMAGGIAANTGLVGPTEVLVDEDDLERAQELLDAPFEAPLEDEDDNGATG